MNPTREVSFFLVILYNKHSHSFIQISFIEGLLRAKHYTGLWAGENRLMYQEVFSCWWQKSGWNNKKLIIDHRKLRGRQFCDWLIEQLIDDIKYPILSFLRLLIPAYWPCHQMASLMVSRWLCHLQALHPHNNLKRQQKDLLFLASLKIQKTFARALLVTSHASLNRIESYAHALTNHW